MIVDTSVLVAILRQEQEFEHLSISLRRAETRRMTAVSYLELVMVYVEAGDSGLVGDIDELVAGFQIDIVEVSLDQLELAIDAFLKYGKGRHPAKLNFGDCFPYALAKHLNEPLLFRGNDFEQTDVQVAELVEHS